MYTIRISLATLAATLVLVVPAAGQSAEPAEGSVPTVLENPALVQQYQQTITPEDLGSHLFVFASDYFEGRETTTRGQKLAAYYLAGQYRKLGLEPAGTAESIHPYAPEAYFQPFEVHGQRLEEARLSVTIDGEVVGSSAFSADQQTGDSFLQMGTLPQADAGVVFAGYGIADESLGYDDFAALEDQDVSYSGKWLLILRDEPLSDENASLLPTADGGLSAWSRSIFQKYRAAISGGQIPTGILVVGDVGPRGSDVVEQARRAAAGLDTVGSLSLAETGGRSRLPIHVISKNLANNILAPSGRTVEEAQQQIDETLTPVVFSIPDVRVQSELKFTRYKAGTENVLALIRGTDPLVRDEVVVISSHYDHIGIDPTAEGDQINNGADDDGSGTVTTLEVAEAFMEASRDGYGPRRSVLFLNVSGEEKGLLGSEFYADNPVFPMEKTVTNLNIDMIGRHDPTYPGEDPHYVYIIGSNLISQELHDLNLRVNKLTGTELELNERFNSPNDPNRFYARSDHWNFGKHGVPFIFFFTGTHDDYHQPGDEADKIDYDRMADIARLIFATAWQVANQDAAPAVSGRGFH